MTKITVASTVSKHIDTVSTRTTKSKRRTSHTSGLSYDYKSVLGSWISNHSTNSQLCYINHHLLRVTKRTVASTVSKPIDAASARTTKLKEEQVKPLACHIITN